MKKKTAIIVLSDPAGGEESLGRVFNAMASAYEFDRSGDTVTLRFQGTGTRWPVLLDDPAHPAHDLYQAVRHTIGGVSCGCADVFGAADDVAKTGMNLIKDNPVPGTSGMAGFRALIEDGYSVLSF